MDGVRGSAVQLCSRFGIPFVRLRAAVPEEWFAGSVAHAVGRREGVSVESLSAHQDTLMEHLKLVLGAVGTCCSAGPENKARRP